MAELAVKIRVQTLKSRRRELVRFCASQAQEFGRKGVLLDTALENKKKGNIAKMHAGSVTWSRKTRYRSAAIEREVPRRIT